MMEGILYPQKANILKNRKRIFSAALLACGLLLSGGSAFSQTYNNVTHLAGTMMVAGNNVTVSSAGVRSSTICGGLSQPYVEGSDVLGIPSVGVGSYTWSFGTPVNSIRIYMESIDAIDVVAILINGTPYFITSSNITPLASGSTCFGSTGTAIASGAGTIVNSGGGTNSATIEINPGVAINTVTIESQGTGASAGVVNNFSFASNTDPSFVNGGIELFSICESSGLSNVDSRLAVNDADMGQPFTWTVTTAPDNGSVSGLPYSTTTTGGTITPAGVGYMPDAGFFGFDTLIVQGTDGVTTIVDTLVITVKPLPTLNSATTLPSICSGALLSYVPTSPVAGTTFNWTRNFVGGISNPSATGTDNPNEVLNNITYYNVTVNYVYSMVADGCSNMQTVSVVVKPKPALNSPLTASVCNGQIFNYPLTSATPGTTFTWSRDPVGGITPSTGSGTGNISEALTNSTGSPVNVYYEVGLNANSCTSVQTVTVTVAPPVIGTPISTKPATPTLCEGTMYQTFGAANPAAPGINYTWSVTNGTIDAYGAGNQYIIVSFANPGTSVVTLNTSVPGSSCLSSDSYTATITINENPSAAVIYYNHQFVYLDNTVSTYQWGYDDRTSLAPSTITGAEFQSYPNSSPDFTNKYYWVKTTKNGCTQKTYYNAPPTVGVSNVLYAGASLDIFPNPATNMVTVNVAAQADVTVSLTDMMGQTVKTMTGSGRNMQIDIASLPAGCYLVSCAENGVKIATSRFIKN